MELVKNLKQTNIYKYFLVILISSTLLAISAKLKIPFYPVPMTMQTFVVLLIGVCFGWKLGGAIITFYLFEAQEMCDRIAIINKGNLVALDTTKKLLDRIKTKKITFKLEEFQSNLELSLPNVEFLVQSNNTIAVNYEKESINFEQLINYLKEKNLKILDISIDEGDLEDVFIQLTKN